MSDSPSPRSVPFHVIAAGNARAGLGEPGIHALRHRAEFDRLWRTVAGDRPMPQAALDVDWAETMIVFAALGTRPSGGHSISVERIVLHDAFLSVHVRETSPGRGRVATSALTHPYVAVAIPAYQGPIDYVLVNTEEA